VVEARDQAVTEEEFMVAGQAIKDGDIPFDEI
jgi:hypothetical protein